MVTRLSSHVFAITSPLSRDSFGAVSKLWVHVPTLSRAVYFALFRVLKGLQDSGVRRYVCPKVSLLGVMVLGLHEPNLTPFTSKGDPGVGVQGPPGPIGPPGPKVSRCPIPGGEGSGQVGGRAHSGASPGKGSCWDHSSLCYLCSRETWAPLAPLVLLVLSASLVSQALEERRVSQAPVESG